MPSGGRVLAVDWGRKRFGVALSDPLRMIASPLAVLTRRAGQRAPVGRVLELVRQYEVSEIVVGLPLTSEGEEGEEAREARAFGDALGARSGLKVWYVDERMSTARALRAARDAGVSAKGARGRVDALAAVGILQGWLDRQ